MLTQLQTHVTQEIILKYNRTVHWIKYIKKPFEISLKEHNKNKNETFMCAKKLSKSTAWI